MNREDAPSRNLGLTRRSLAALWEQSTNSGGRALPITKNAKLCCCAPGREAAVFVFSGRLQIPIKSAKGFSVEIKTDDKLDTQLKIENHSTQDEDIFAYVVLDLIELDFSFENESSRRRFGVIIGRIKAWRTFMQDRSRRLSPSQELGLYGELFFLKKCLEQNIAIDSLQAFWTGPFRSARDFAFADDVFVEVKTSTNELPLRVKIDSLEQLDSASVRQLLLAVVVLKPAEPDVELRLEGEKASGSGYRTLPELADEIVSDLKSACLKEEFRTLLLIAGLTDEQRKECRRRYRPESLSFFRAEHLPSLTPGKIQGIIKASYEIEILNASGNPSYGLDNPTIEKEAAWKLLRTSGTAAPSTVCVDDEIDFE